VEELLAVVVWRAILPAAAFYPAGLA